MNDLLAPRTLRYISLFSDVPAEHRAPLQQALGAFNNSLHLLERNEGAEWWSSKGEAAQRAIAWIWEHLPATEKSVYLWFN